MSFNERRTLWEGHPSHSDKQKLGTWCRSLDQGGKTVGWGKILHSVINDLMFTTLRIKPILTLYNHPIHRQCVRSLLADLPPPPTRPPNPPAPRVDFQPPAQYPLPVGCDLPKQQEGAVPCSGTCDTHSLPYLREAGLTWPTMTC